MEYNREGMQGLGEGRRGNYFKLGLLYAITCLNVYLGKSERHDLCLPFLNRRLLQALDVICLPTG